MSRITGKTVELDVNKNVVFDFFSSLKNLERLLPKDKIENGVFGDTEASFRIKNLADIALKLENPAQEDRVVLTSTSNKPFPFSLSIVINETSESTSSAYAELNGEINTFMAMMVQKPLKNFLDLLADELKSAV